jgi:hypothetical protein
MTENPEASQTYSHSVVFVFISGRYKCPFIIELCKRVKVDIGKLERLKSMHDESPFFMDKKMTKTELLSQIFISA